MPMCAPGSSFPTVNVLAADTERSAGVEPL